MMVKKMVVQEMPGAQTDQGVKEEVVKSPLRCCFQMKSAQNVPVQGVAAPEPKLLLLGEMGVRIEGTLLQNLRSHHC